MTQNRLLLTGALLLALSSPLDAQDAESFASLHVPGNATGSRSAAMGGTSEALTDHFTMNTNPASLARQRQRSAAVSLDAKERTVTAAAVVIPAQRFTWAVFAGEPVRGWVPGIITWDTPAPFNVGPFHSLMTLRRAGTAAALSRGPLSLGASIQHTQLRYDRSHMSATTWNAGLQWQVAPAVRAGASYRSGNSFRDKTLTYYFVPGPGESYNVWTSAYTLPSSYAAGIAVDVGPKLTIALDAVRVRYSEVTHPLVRNNFDMPDATELRAGAEYRIPGRLPVALRAGYWRDPEHATRPLVVYGDDQHQDHVTYGIGVGDRVRVDAAIDRTEYTTRGYLTVASRF